MNEYMIVWKDGEEIKIDYYFANDTQTAVNKCRAEIEEYFGVTPKIERVHRLVNNRWFIMEWWN